MTGSIFVLYKSSLAGSMLKERFSQVQCLLLASLLANKITVIFFFLPMLQTGRQKRDRKLKYYMSYYSTKQRTNQPIYLSPS